MSKEKPTDYDNELNELKGIIKKMEEESNKNKITVPYPHYPYNPWQPNYPAYPNQWIPPWNYPGYYPNYPVVFC